MLSAMVKISNSQRVYMMIDYDTVDKKIAPAEEMRFSNYSLLYFSFFFFSFFPRVVG